MSIIIPTNPKDLEKIANVIDDICDAKTMIAAKNDYIREAKKELREEYQLDAKSVTAMIKWRYDEILDEIQEQVDLFEAVFK